MDRTTLAQLEETPAARALEEHLDATALTGSDALGEGIMTLGLAGLLFGGGTVHLSDGPVGWMIGTVIALAGAVGMVHGHRLDKKATKKVEEHKEADAAWGAHWDEVARELAEELETHYGISGIDPEAIPLDEDESIETEVTRDGALIGIRIVQRHRDEPLVVLEVARELTPA